MPGQGDTFYFPAAFLLANGMADLIPPDERGSVILIKGKSQVEDMAYLSGGRANRPRKPVMLVGPDGTTPVMVAGAGNVEGAELEEIALAEWERQEERIKRGRPAGIDFEAIRGRRGLPPREQFDQDFREAVQRRINAHKRNPVTDPQKQVKRPLRGWVTVPERRW